MIVDHFYKKAIQDGLKAVIGHLDYDLAKDIDMPEDPINALSWADLADLFLDRTSRSIADQMNRLDKGQGMQ
jgi:hypothetical protein